MPNIWMRRMLFVYLQKEEDSSMVVLVFLLIAYSIRHKFLRENTPNADKALYYAFCVFMTPLFGPWVYKMIVESKIMSREEEEKDDSYGYIIP